MNTKLEIPHETNRFSFFSQSFSNYYLKVSIEKNGRLRGWVTSSESIEVPLKGLPTYLNPRGATQLLEQSYLKFCREAIEVFPRGLGGMKRTELPETTEEQDLFLYQREEPTKPMKETLDLTGQEYQAVCTALKKLKSSSTVENLNLLGCRDLKDQDLKNVTKMCTLKKIDLSNCNHISARMIKELLTANPRIKRLVLKKNSQIKKKDLQDIFKLGVSLQYINLEGCKQLRDQEVINIPETFWRTVILPSGNSNSARNIHASVNALRSRKEQCIVRPSVKILLCNDPAKKELPLRFNGDFKLWKTGAKILGVALEINQTIETLDLENQRIEANGAKALARAIKRNPKLPLRQLNLRENQIGDEGTKALARTIERNPQLSLQQLNLTRNQIGTVGAKALAQAIERNPLLSLQELNLQANPIGDVGAQALARALRVNQSIQTLVFASNNLGNASAQALASTLIKNQTLKKLDLAYNNISNYGAQKLGKALKNNRGLQTLCIAFNAIEDYGAQVLAASLEENQTLRALNLGSKIGAAGAQALGAALEVNQTLQSLNLRYNQIGDAGVQVLGAALQVNQSLQRLALERNDIGVAGVQALGEALKVNQSLQSLNLYSNRIGNDGIQFLGAALEVNQSLQSLNLGGNQIGNDGAQVLGTAFKINQSIQELKLNNNQIGAAGAQALGEALQINQSLQSLNLSDNKIGNVGVQALRAALQVNQSIQKLNLGRNSINGAGRIALNQILELLRVNQEMAAAFQEQITQVQNFLQSHENDEDILLQNLPQLKELLQKWHTDSKNIIPSLQKIFQRSNRTDLNDRYRKKLKDIITNLSHRLHDLWLESFERKVVALSNKYVMSQASSKERNVELGYALHETWLTFFGSNCPNWLEDYIELLIPFGVLLDIAEGGEKKDISNLTDARSLFERVLSFNTQSQQSQ